MLLLHGFGEFWWAWRHQLPVAGRRRVQRRRGRSPRVRRDRQDSARLPPVRHRPGRLGGDPQPGVLRPRTVVGHDWGGIAAWSTLRVRARAGLARLAAIAAPHPLRFPWRSMGTEPGLVPAADPARARDHGPATSAYVEWLLRRRAAAGAALPDERRGRHYRQALRLWPSPHCALEYLRMFGRDQLRAAGRDYRQALRSPVQVPVLTVRGSADRLLPASAMLPPDPVRADRSPARGDPRRRPPAARGGPGAVSAALLDWLPAG